MNSKIEKAYLELIKSERGGAHASPSFIIITIFYLIAVLSIPLYAPQKLIWLAGYPIMASEVIGIGYGRILYKSLWILPLLGLIGIFNPIIDQTKAFEVMGLYVSQGWVSFISILLRGMLCLQAVLLMVSYSGFFNVFNVMRKLGVPKVLCTQLMLTYRYIFVIMEESINMKRARDARGYGRKSYPLKMWGRFIGQLLIRSAQRSVRIHRAMKSRGFNGIMHIGKPPRWTHKEWVNLIGWCGLIAMLRFIDFSRIFNEISG